MRILETRRLSTPTLAGAIEDTDARLGRDVALHPSPARCSLGEPVEQDHGGRPRACTTQIETVTGDQVGATSRGRVTRRRFGDGLVCSSKGDQSQDDEGGIEKRSPRPVVKRAVRTAPRPHDKCREQKRPHPAEPTQHTTARPEDDECEANDPEPYGRGKRPRLRLIRTATSKPEEHQHPKRERDQSRTRYDVLASATEYPEDEHQPKNQPESDRAENNQANVTSAASLLRLPGRWRWSPVDRPRWPWCSSASIGDALEESVSAIEPSTSCLDG